MPEVFIHRSDLFPAESDRDREGPAQECDAANGSIGVAISQKANHDLMDLLRIEWHLLSLIFEDRIIAQVNYNEVLDVGRAQVH